MAQSGPILLAVTWRSILGGTSCSWSCLPLTAQHGEKQAQQGDLTAEKRGRRRYQREGEGSWQEGGHTENGVHGGSLRPSVGPSSRLSLPLCTRSSGPCWTCSGLLLDMLLGRPQLSGQPGSRR